MALWLRCWIPKPGVSRSKPLGGSRVDSTVHPSEVDKMSTRNFWVLSGKKVYCFLEVDLASRQLNPIHIKGPQSVFSLCLTGSCVLLQLKSFVT